MSNFIDSNVVLYLIDNDEAKKIISRELVATEPFISPQVLTEVANVCKRKFKYSKEQVMIFWSLLLDDCKFVGTDKSVFDHAEALVKRYDFQIFDSLIVASALKADSPILYSEDMQHRLVVEKKLTIINPFI